MSVNNPSFNECTLLFESNKNLLDIFYKKYEKIIEHYHLDKETPLDTLFLYIFGVVIDWREYDSDIIKYFSKHIPEKNVDVEETQSGLNISYNGNNFEIKLSFSGTDRYITIYNFNKIISNDYEIRLFDSSFYSDTHVFLILPKLWWNGLDKKYGEDVKKIFTVITEGLDFP